MREPAHPEVFPEHLRQFLLPVPETRYEALFLLGLFPKESRETKEDCKYGLHDRIESVEGPSSAEVAFLRSDRFPLFGG